MKRPLEEFPSCLELVLPFSLVSAVKDFPLNKNYHFYGKNTKEQRLMIVGKKCSEDSFQLNIFGPHEDEASSSVRCLVKDAHCLSALTDSNVTSLDNSPRGRKVITRNIARQTLFSEVFTESGPANGLRQKTNRKKIKTSPDLNKTSKSVIKIERDIPVIEDNLDISSLKAEGPEDKSAIPVCTESALLSDSIDDPEELELEDIKTLEKSADQIGKCKSRNISQVKQEEMKCEMDPCSASETSNLYHLGMQSKHLLSAEVQRHLVDKSFKCLICRYSAILKNTFKSHILRSHNLTFEQYKDKFDLSDLKGHQEDATDDKVSPFKATKQDGEDNVISCKLCQHPVSSPEQLCEHLVIEHHLSFGEYEEQFVGEDKTTSTNKVEDLKTETTDLPGHKTFAQPRKPKAKNSASDKKEPSVKFICKICNGVYSSKISYSAHLRKVHEGDERSKQLLQDLQESRWKSRKGSTLTSCPFCAEEYGGSSVLMHMRVSHTKEETLDEMLEITEKSILRQQYQKNTREKRLTMVLCPHCSTLMKQCTLGRHVKNHCKKNPDVQRRYDCHKCSFFSCDKQQMQEHKRTAHCDDRTYICDTCAAVFSTSTGLRQHQRIKHKQVHKKPLPEKTCPVCDKVFHNNNSYNRHFKTHQDKECKFRCTQCDQSFERQSLLEYHLRTVHTQVYSCQVCGATASDLSQHKCEPKEDTSELQDQQTIYTVGTDGIIHQYTSAAPEQTDTQTLAPAYTDDLLVVMDTTLPSDAAQRVVNVATLPDGSTVVLMPGDTGLEGEDLGREDNDLFTIYQTDNQVGYCLDDGTTGTV